MKFFYKSDHVIFFPKINGNDIQVVPKKMRSNPYGIFFQSLPNYHRDNLYIPSKII